MRGSISHEMRKEYCKRTTSHLRKERKVKDIIYLLGLPFSIVLIINYGYDSLTYISLLITRNLRILYFYINDFPY